jgi:hypothetical protein
LPAYSYTPGEIAWLKSLNGEQTEDGDWIDGDEQARAIDVQSLNATGHWGAGDESGLPVIARWHDVQRAARNIEDRHADRMLEMRVNGATERLKFTRRQEEDLLPRDPHVGQWKRATEAAGNGEPPPQMSELPRVSLPVVDVEPERQTHVCEEHLLPELRVRVIRERRWPA